MRKRHPLSTPGYRIKLIFQFFSRGRGRGRGDRGRGDRGRGRGGRGGKDEKEKWVPVTKLGRLVQDGKIKNIEHIYVHSLPVKEAEIIDYFFGFEVVTLVSTFGFIGCSFSEPN